MVHITTGRLLGCLIILGSIFLLSAGLVEGEPHAPRGLLRPAFQRPPIPWRVVGAGATCPQLGGGARGPTEMKEPRRVGASLWMQEAGTSPGAAAADGASGEGPSRKQRRRLNRKTRNNSRNRIASDESGESSIRRNTELSQHFLTDKIIIERLVAEAKDHSSQGSCVVELGPGLGAITAPLLELYPKMTAVELDGLAVAELRGRFPGLDVREMSLLDFDFAAHAKARGGRLTVIANLPFGISSQTLYKLLDNSKHIRRAVLVLQQEVVNRIMADQSQRKYSTLSVEHMLRCERVEEVIKVPAIAFSPAPRRTKTAAVVIDYAVEAAVDEEEGEILRAVMTQAFDNKPKVLADSIWKSSRVRRAVPNVRDVCNSDINWLQKKPADLAPGKWLHVARSLTSMAIDQREANEEGAL